MASIVGSESAVHDGMERALRLFSEFIQVVPVGVADKGLEEARSWYDQKGFHFRYYQVYTYGHRDLVSGYERMLLEITKSGLSVHVASTVTDIAPQDAGFRVTALSRGDEMCFHAQRVILACGRYGHVFVARLGKVLGLRTEANHCDIGVRLEFPTSVWPDIDRHHGDLKLLFGNARTFCVCKDGRLAPYKLGGVLLMEGRSGIDSQSGFTNLAVLVRLGNGNHGRNGALFEELATRLKRETGGVPIRQRLGDFLARMPSLPSASDEPTTMPLWKWGSIAQCFAPAEAAGIREALVSFVTRLLPENACKTVSLFAPEIDHLGDKFVLQQSFESTRPGIHIIGDCTGHFRGILQAFSSGIECARNVAGAADVR
jgi:uncharacterized FAD-dependent dehydrogenase